MRDIFVLGFVAGIALVFCAKPAVAASAPKQLHNKTVRANWTVELETKAPSGRVYRVPMHVAGNVYISSAGRMFISGSRTSVNRGTETNLGTPGSGKLGNNKANATFRGNQLIGTVMAASGGAVQTTISFDPSFSSCTVNVVYGKGGKANAKYPGINEPGPYEMLSYKISNNICSISEGNAFAG